MVQLTWSDLTDADVGAVRDLAAACMEVDGGMPTLRSEESIRRLFRSGPGRVGRDMTGEIVAAVAIFRDAGVHPTATGLVHPSLRGAGVGEQLVQWAQEAAGEPLRLLVENDTPGTEAFAHEVGMARIFAETVMRHSLHKIPHIPKPDGLTMAPWRDDTVADFHRAWAESFAERPGFTPLGLPEWRAWVESEPTFLPEESRVALDDEGPVGFVTVSTYWIDQAGVVPRWRGRALGAHLMVRSLTALKDRGSRHVWLCVTNDNPARELYLRLGFRIKGERARYAAPSAHGNGSPTA